MPKKKKKETEKIKEKRKAKAFVQKPPQFWEGQPWDLMLCPTQFISISPGPAALERPRAAELLQLHRPAALQPELSHCPTSSACCQLLFGCHESHHRLAASALLCDAWLNYLQAPGRLLMKGEHLSFLYWRINPSLLQWRDLHGINDPSQNTTLEEKQTAASSFPCPMPGTLLQLWAWPGTISFWPMSPGANF